MASGLFFAGKRRGQKDGDEEGPGREVLPHVSVTEGGTLSGREALCYELIVGASCVATKCITSVFVDILSIKPTRYIRFNISLLSLWMLFQIYTRRLHMHQFFFHQVCSSS